MAAIQTEGSDDGEVEEVVLHVSTGLVFDGGGKTLLCEITPVGEADETGPAVDLFIWSHLDLGDEPVGSFA